MNSNRRQFASTAAGLAGVAATWSAIRRHGPDVRKARSRVAILSVEGYSDALETLLLAALRDFGLNVRGRNVLLKPNLVEHLPGAPVNTNPKLIGAAATCFLRLGASRVVVGGLTTELANAFIGWLNENRTGRDEPLQENSRAKLFGTLRRLMKHLRQLPKWSGRIPRDLYIRDSPWPMRHLKRKATEILESEDLRRLLSACAEEVTSTIHRIEEGWRLREAARDSLPSSHQGYMAYADLGVSLAALEAQLGGQILRTDVVHEINRGLEEAITKLHGGLISVGEYFYPT